MAGSDVAGTEPSLTLQDHLGAEVPRARGVDMLPFHERLAKLGLAAIAERGFVLAGGYAVSANGIGNRPSDDVDLFTSIPDPTRLLWRRPPFERH